jgi:dienelactone hydrolase
MKKLVFIFSTILVLISIIIYYSLHTPALSAQHGKFDCHLFLAEGNQQPLVVAFGGGSGGNDWERRYLKGKRDSLLANGFALLAIGYFKTENTPDALDRISLEALADTIFKVAKRNKQIDASKIILMGASKGGELVLNLASRDKRFAGVVALSTSHVSFPALTVGANTSSWLYNGKQVAYVPAPFKTIVPAIKGNLYEAFAIMLEDTLAVDKARIEVEKINGPILILSGNKDEQWPATKMSDEIIKRLKQQNFSFTYQHIVLNGAHNEPLNQFDTIIYFLNKEFKIEEMNL